MNYIGGTIDHVPLGPIFLVQFPHHQNKLNL